MSYNPPYYTTFPASGPSSSDQETHLSSTNSHLPSPPLGQALNAHESQSMSASYYYPPGANPVSQAPPLSSLPYRSAQQVTSPPTYGYDHHASMDPSQDYPSPASIGDSNSPRPQATSLYPSASTSRSATSTDDQDQNLSRSQVQDEVYQLPSPPQTVYSPSSPSVSSETDSTTTAVHTEPDLDVLISMDKSVDLPKYVDPADALNIRNIVAVKQEEAVGDVAWTDPMGNVHMLQTLVRLATCSVVKLVPSQSYL